MKFIFKKISFMIISILLVLEIGIVPFNINAKEDNIDQEDNDLNEEKKNDSISSDINEQEELNYYYGRELTQEEIDVQNALVPELKPLPNFNTKIDNDVPFSKGRNAYPSSFDSRNHGVITAVKNQNPYGTCWAVSSTSAMETAMIRAGLGNINLNMSERALAFFTFNNVNDPLNLTGGDSTFITNGNNWLNNGGSGEMASLTLARGMGPLDESFAPYNGNAVASEFAYNHRSANIKEAIYVNPSNVSKIKECIMNYSAGTVAYDHVNSYMNNSTGAYFIGNFSGWWPNHEVSIVGWDDNYSRLNFNANCRPARNGAFLIKNSFGTNYAAGGYTWISYEDGTFSALNPLPLIFYAVNAKDSYDNNYQYDGTSLPASKTFSKGASIVNQYTVQNEFELLDSISFMTYTANSNYSIQIYKNPSNIEDPRTGIPLLSTSQKVYVQDGGFHKFTLNQSFMLKKDDVFAVEIVPDRDVNFAVSATMDGNNSYAGISSKNTVFENQSFLIDNSVIDLSDLSINPRIKAYTKNQKVVLNEKELNLKVGEKRILNASFYSQNIQVQQELIWTSSNPECVSVDMNGNIEVLKEGYSEIIASTQDGVFSSCIVYSPDKSNFKISVKEVQIEDIDWSGYTIILSVDSLIGLDKVYYPTWTTKNGQDDILWKYEKTNSNEVKIRVNTKDHNYEYGGYQTILYAYDKFGNMAEKKLTEIIIPKPGKPTINEVNIVDLDEKGYTVQAKVENATSALCPTWTIKNGQDDLIWGKAKIKDNTLTYRVNSSDHKNESGEYITHLYIKNSLGEEVQYAISPNTIVPNPPKLEIKNIKVSNVTSSGYTVTCKVDAEAGFKEVKFPTWTTKNGQDDITWDTVTANSNGEVTYQVKTSDHKNEHGEYQTMIFAYDQRGEYTISEVFKVTLENMAPEIKNVKITNSKGENYKVSCEISDPDGFISHVQFPTWTTKNGQDDITWGVASSNTNDITKYEFTINAYEHKYESGEYNTHIYATDNDGKTTILILDKQNIEDIDPIISDLQVTNITGSGYTVSGTIKGANSINCASWTEANGQDDIIWEPATLSKNTFSYRMNVKNHNFEAGVYNTHLYANSMNGKVTAVSIPQQTLTVVNPSSTWKTVNGIKYFYDGYGNVVGQGGAKKIIDVSSWQGKIDWDTVKKHSDIDGVILRCGWAWDGEDAQFARNVSELNRLGIPYGVYLYTYASNATEATWEANHTVQLLRKYSVNLSYPIYYDVENWRYEDGSKTAPTDTGTWVSIINTYLNTMSANGYNNVDVYSYRSLLQTRLNHPDILKHVSWAAAYTDSLSWKNPYYSGRFGWQYTNGSDGLAEYIPGIGWIDISCWYSV